MSQDDDVHYQNLTDEKGVLVLAGPKSRELLERVSDHDFSNEAFPWLSAQEIEIDDCRITAMRVNYVGELGWELHHELNDQNIIFDKLFENGSDLGLKPFGIRAMDSMRFEKSYRMVGTELSIEYSAFESSMDRFIQTDKENFLGKESLLAWQKKNNQSRLVTLEVDEIKDADVLGNNAVTIEGQLIGRATGGNFGYRVNKSLALAMLDIEKAEVGTRCSIDILGEIHPATVIADSPFDPKNERLRDVNNANK